MKLCVSGGTSPERVLLSSLIRAKGKSHELSSWLCYMFTLICVSTNYCPSHMQHTAMSRLSALKEQQPATIPTKVSLGEGQICHADLFIIWETLQRTWWAEHWWGSGVDRTEPSFVALELYCKGILFCVWIQGRCEWKCYSIQQKPCGRMGSFTLKHCATLTTLLLAMDSHLWSSLFPPACPVSALNNSCWQPPLHQNAECFRLAGKS